MRPRYYGVIDGQVLRVFWRRADAERWAALRPEASIVPVKSLADAEEAVF